MITQHIPQALCVALLLLIGGCREDRPATVSHSRSTDGPEIAWDSSKGLKGSGPIEGGPKRFHNFVYWDSAETTGPSMLVGTWKGGLGDLGIATEKMPVEINIHLDSASPDSSFILGMYRTDTGTRYYGKITAISVRGDQVRIDGNVVMRTYTGYKQDISEENFRDFRITFHGKITRYPEARATTIVGVISASGIDDRAKDFDKEGLSRFAVYSFSR